jgi:hypothetical protein
LPRLHRDRLAEQIEAAHQAAVSDTLSWLERHAVFTRLGAGGVRQVETSGLIARCSPIATRAPVIRICNPRGGEQQGADP